MKKIALLISMFLGILGVSAQGVVFGHFKQKEKVKALLAKKPSKDLQVASVTRAIVPVEEYAELDEDRRYRYVYAYNANKERSSETIYMREREDGKWSEEVLYTVGTYTYEYDTQGRVKAKSVTYDNTDIPFKSYRIMVAYGDDGSATYTKYECNYEDAYEEVEKWTYRADGTLASHTLKDDYSSYGDTYVYDEKGNVSAFNSYSLSGSLNDVTIIYADEDVYESNSSKHYTYDGKTGKLLEFWQTGGWDDTERYTFEYDAQGRIVNICVYVEEEGDEIDAPVVVGPSADGEKTETRASSADAMTWRLSYKESYTYFGDEVYGVTNPWKAVFGIDGPVVTITSKEYDTYTEGGDVNGDGVIDERDDAANCEYESIITFTRDANGKLTAVKETNNETAGSVESGTVVSVDNEGQIVKVKMEFEESWNGGYDESGNWDESIQNYFYELEEQTYTWENGKITQMTDCEKWSQNYEGKSDNGEYSYTTRYTYTENGVTMAKTQDNVDGGSTELTSMSQVGNRYMVKHWYDSSNTDGKTDNFDWETDDYIIRDVQTEDVSFVRPNLKKDREGFTADVPIVLSRAGRVVCVGYESMGSGDDCINSEMDGNWHFMNIEAEEDEYSSKDELMGIYYSISHDGDLTIASNVEGLPVYVLKGSRLLKEYRYYDMDYSSNGSMGTRAVTIPAGQAYDETSYIYNEGGLLVGMQLVSVDEDGERTGEITLEYKYDANGVVHTEMEAKGRVVLNSRTLAMNDGATFDIYSANGQTIAANVASYTFNQAGIYIIVTKAERIKLTVK